jgi:hypothetical protein
MERRDRRASLTDLESGNARVNSGSIRTTFVPTAYRSTYLPRTPPEKSYSGLISALERLDRGFFVFSVFILRRKTSADQSRPLSSHSINHYQHPALVGPSDDDETLLIAIVIRVWDCNRKRVTEHVLASANETRCLRRFESSFFGSHSKHSPAIALQLNELRRAWNGDTWVANPAHLA